MSDFSASYPDLMSPGEIVTEMFRRAKDIADEMRSKSEALFDKALGEAGAAKLMSPAAIAFAPAVVEPKVHIPELAEGASVEMFNVWWDRVNGQLTDKMVWFINTFFPNECPYLQRAQLWICRALTTGGTGMSPQVEDQIWQRDRARILKEARRAEDEALRAFAARGFPMPSGLLAGALERIREDTLDKTAQASRDVAIKQAEIEIENVKFAVDKAIDLYTRVVAAAADFVKALVSSANMTTQLIPSITDSQSRLISAASGYYQQRVAVEELRLKATLPNGEWRQEAARENQDAEMQAMRNRVDAAIEAAKALATEAAAALNALHVSSSTSGTGSTSVSYGYKGDVNASVPPKTVA